MNSYVRNRKCRCVRCLAHDMVGPALFITVGVLGLLRHFTGVRYEQSFPVLLLVIGAVLLVARTGSTEGHVDPSAYGVVPPPGVTTQVSQTNPQPWTTGIDAPPAPPTEPTDTQVKP